MKVLNVTKKQNGFTLIELIVVMVILGVLAALAVPRFLGFTETARERVVNGGEAAVKSAAFAVRAKFVAEEGANNPVDVDGQDVTVDARGYPVTADGGICSAVDFDDEVVCTPGADTATIQYDGRAECSFTYAVQPAPDNVVITPFADDLNCS